jgi:murein DD-endopeptidase MepM/ murein hydrolase activator NlpD
LNNGLPVFAKEAVSLVTQLLQQHPKRITAAVAALLLCGTGATFAVATFAPQTPLAPLHTVVEPVPLPPLAAQIELLQTQTQKLFRSDVTRSSDTADSLLKRMGVFDPQAAAFLRSDSLVQQNLLGRAGRNVNVETISGSTLTSLKARWSPEDDGMFKRLSVQKTAAGYESRLEVLPMAATSRLASGTISTSLFAATDEARIPDAVALQLAEIFSGDIDFHRALRKGDRFAVVYETLEGDGEPLRAGRVLSAEFENAGKSYQAMWFQEPLSSATTNAPAATHTLTKGGYYTLAGDSLRRAYLSSPLAFSRITSGFKMRMHPILRTWRAHTGVDYAAPTGTPVRCVGDGVVDFAGVQGGYGNMVMVRHANGHSTVYAHLSRIDVRRGQTLTQGQIVGAVGATGWATGPHLHYEFRVNGVFRDPLTIARKSEAVPVAPALRPLFAQLAQQVRADLDAAAQVQMGRAE